MSNRADFRMVIDTFKFYYKSINKSENFTVKMTDSRVKFINNFIQLFKEKTNSQFLQKDILNQFVEWNFNHFVEKGTYNRFGSKSIQIEWIYGKTAFERWAKLNPKYFNFIMNKNIRKKVDYKVDIKKENWDNIIVQINELEENDKERFFGEDECFDNCYLFTSLYNHKSHFCMKCDLKIKCKETLKEENINLYKKRGYG